MNHGRKINKIDTPLTSKSPELLSFVRVTDALLLKDEPIAKEHQLINWKRWLKKHQKQYQVLDKGGSQSKTNMVINSCEKIRSKTEMSNLIEYATISASPVPDGYRGDLGFWQEPPLFSNHGNSCVSKVGPVLPKKEPNLLPTLGYVGMPMSIRKENLLNPLQKVPAWNCSSYLKKKQRELADTMAIPQPSIPEAASLISRGQGFNHDEKYVAHVSVISIRDMSLGNEDSEFKIRESSVSTAGVVNLKINDLEITRDERSIFKSSESTSEEITWTLNFPSKIHQMSEKYLYFENTGTVAITYQWRNAISTSKILPLSSRNYAKFFFNKNKALILPGQKVEFPIWFQSRRAGTFSESWRMETQPIVSRAALIIRMCGHAAVENNIHTSQLEADVYLDCCIRNTAIRETIDEIIHNGMPSGPPEPTYKSLYLEAEIFQVKNLSYFYHASLVTQLYRLYTTASAPDVPLWTLSLVDLRHVLLRIKDPNMRHERLKMFGELCQQCLGPCLFNPVRNTKYEMVYSVLCASLNRMEEESDSVKRNCILTDTNTATSTETGNRSSPNSLLAPADVKPLRTTSDRSFYVRTYELLVEAVEQACVVIDSLKNLDELEQ